MEKQVKCKVYLTSSKSLNDPIDIKIFNFPMMVFNGITVHVEKLFQTFKSSVHQAFPAVFDYNIYYIDDEKDFISITSFLEFGQVLTGQMEKFCIIPNSKGYYPDVVQEEKIGNETIIIHQGITCDGCRMVNIKGKRYKCLECSNFDLCGECESKGMHPLHNMILFVKPDTVLNKKLSTIINYLV